MSVSDTQEALKLWQRIVTRSLRELPYDLSQRQTAVLLTVYMVPAPHTIRNLAERLNISKPAVCRALDALSALDLIRRKKDEEDRRNVFIQRTVNGSVFLRDFADLMVQESKNPTVDSMPLFAPMAA
ncbi:MAG: MarR family transcriptional regulator [Alphaproteobacteria bacterium]|nr:MarR family transcriptional regulator [Alphaproteobacteria bacterium]